MDDFHTLCMHVSLPVAARLNYRHDFPGMFNHVSQTVYFHKPNYKRTVRHPFADLGNAPPSHTLPALWQIYPQIPVKYEEDAIDPSQSQGWYWLVLAGRVYLVSPEPTVFYSDDVTALLRRFVEAQAGVD